MVLGAFIFFEEVYNVSARSRNGQPIDNRRVRERAADAIKVGVRQTVGPPTQAQAPLPNAVWFPRARPMGGHRPPLQPKRPYSHPAPPTVCVVGPPGPEATAGGAEVGAAGASSIRLLEEIRVLEDLLVAEKAAERRTKQQEGDGFARANGRRVSGALSHSLLTLAHGMRKQAHHPTALLHASRRPGSEEHGREEREARREDAWQQHRESQ